MKKNKGFTLVEIIVVLVILALLAAILIPSLTGYIDKGGKTACQTVASAIRRSYSAEWAIAYSEGWSPDFARVMSAAVEDYTGIDTTERQESFTGLCPSGGAYTCEFDPDGTPTITCSQHGCFGYPSYTSIFTSLSENSKVKEYFRRGNTTAATTLDSTGPNWGQPITTALGQQLGVDLTDCYWCITINTMTPRTYNYYWTNEDISGYTAGQTVMVTRYDSASGTYVSGTAAVAQKKESGKTYMVVNTDSFTADGG